MYQHSITQSLGGLSTFEFEEIEPQVSVERPLTTAPDECGFDNCSIVLIDVLARVPDSPG